MIIKEAIHSSSSPLGVVLVREKVTLASAIAPLACDGRQRTVCRFLEGRSADALGYIAECFGARLIGSDRPSASQARDEMALCARNYHRGTVRSSSESYSTCNDDFAGISQHELPSTRRCGFGFGSGERGVMVELMSAMVAGSH